MKTSSHNRFDSAAVFILPAARKNPLRTHLKWLPLAVLLGLAACGTQPGGDSSQWGRGNYQPPGPTGDPWRPYIQEASNRFSVPGQWIRAVMHQESGGHQYTHGRLTRSHSGAIGLMQLMPDTWRDLAAQYHLGNDPYDPHDNIVAGTGYIRQLYDHFGSPGFLAAYNAGPTRVTQYSMGQASLPDETVNYVAAISPHLGSRKPGQISDEVMLASNTGTYNRIRSEAAPLPVATQRQTGQLTRTGDGCLRNADQAYDPASPCLVDQDTPHDNPPETRLASAETQENSSLPVELASYVVPQAHADTLSARRTPPGYRPMEAPTSSSQWAVQVGAFNSNTDAHQVLTHAHSVLGTLTGPDTITPVSTTAGHLYRARITGFHASEASSACQKLRDHAISCFPVAAHT